MARKRTTIGRAWFGGSFARRNIGSFLGPDGRNGGFQVLQRQIKLVRIGPLGFAPEGGLPEGGNKFFQSFAPLVLTRFPRRRGDQQRLPGRHVIENAGSQQTARTAAV